MFQATTIQIGAYAVKLGMSHYSITKNGEAFYSGNLRELISKYKSCFNRQKPDYTKASVALEDAIQAVAKKK